MGGCVNLRDRCRGSAVKAVKSVSISVSRNTALRFLPMSFLYSTRMRRSPWNEELRMQATAFRITRRA